MEQECQKLAKEATGPKYWEDRCKTDSSHRKESKLNTAPSSGSLVREKPKTPTEGKPDGPALKTLLSYPQISQPSKTIVGFGETVIFPVDGSEEEQNISVALCNSAMMA